MAEKPSRMNRTRAVLTAVIVILALLLVGLAVVFFKLLTPSGLPTVSSSPTTMQWVRSMYGFGPAADEQLLSPSSVAIAPSGNIYATDPVRARIMVFRPDGIFLRLLHTGGGGMGKGQFIRPESIAIDRNGDVYIADSWAKKIIVFDRNDKYLREWPVDQQARGVYVADGKVYVLDVGHVIVFDAQGARLSAFGTRGRKPGQIDAYQGIAARAGHIYIADSYNQRLEAFDESGTLLWAVPDKTTASSLIDTNTSGDGSGSRALPGHRWDLPQDLAFDGRGRLLVIDAFMFRIAVVDPETGKVSATYGEYGAEDGQFYYPTSIAYDARRDWVAVADTQNNRVQIVRIPDTAALPVSALWRAAASPYRYLAIPALVLLLAIAFAMWAARQIRSAENPDEGSEQGEEQERNPEDA